MGVVGLGTMGAGIAEVFARNGLTVVGVERDEEAAERGRGHIQHSTDRAVKRGKLSIEVAKVTRSNSACWSSTDSLPRFTARSVECWM